MDQRFNKGKEQFRDRREDQNQGRQFFYRLLQKKGFGNTWCDWIMKAVGLRVEFVNPVHLVLECGSGGAPASGRVQA
jgi:hypothetical protein